MIALWNSRLSEEKARRLIGCTENDPIVTTLEEEATTQLLELINLRSLRKEAEMKVEAPTPVEVGGSAT